MRAAAAPPRLRISGWCPACLPAVLPWARRRRLPRSLVSLQPVSLALPPAARPGETPVQRCRRALAAQPVLRCPVAPWPSPLPCSPSRAFEAAVAASEGDDPLTTWKRYIAWTEKHSIAAELKVRRQRPPGRARARSAHARCPLASSVALVQRSSTGSRFSSAACVASARASSIATMSATSVSA